MITFTAWRRAFAALALGLGLLASAQAKPGQWFEHVLIVVLENEAYEAALQNDYLKQLAARGASFTHYSTLFKPSQPNYLALVGGQNFGVADNEVADVAGANIADLLERQGLTWKQVAQGFPGACSTQGVRGDYVRKHVPFISFKSVQADPKRCANVIDANAFDPKRLPHYTLYSPDNRNNGHDTDLGFAARWLQQFLEPLLNDAEVMKDTLIVVTFDESNSKKRNQLYTVFLGDAVRKGYVSDQPVTHYDLLRTIEDNFALGTLGQGDAAAAAITDVWRR
jgi:Phosphoesterase family